MQTSSILSVCRDIEGELYTLCGECKRRNAQVKEAAERALIKVCDFSDKKEFLSRTQNSSLSYGDVSFPILEVLSVIQTAIQTHIPKFSLIGISCLQRMLSAPILGQSNIPHRQDAHIFLRILNEISKSKDEMILLKVLQTLLMLLSPATSIIVSDRKLMEIILRLLAFIYSSCASSSAVFHTANAGLQQVAHCLVDNALEERKLMQGSKTDASVEKFKLEESATATLLERSMSPSANQLLGKDVKTILSCLIHDLCLMSEGDLCAKPKTGVWLSDVTLEKGVCLDVYLSCFETSPDFFLTDAEGRLTSSMKEMCYNLISMLENVDNVNFHLFLRILQLVRAFLRHAFTPLLKELEIILSGLLNILNSNTYLWKRCVVLEFFRNLCDDPFILHNLALHFSTAGQTVYASASASIILPPDAFEEATGPPPPPTLPSATGQTEREVEEDTESSHDYRSMGSLDSLPSQSSNASEDFLNLQNHHTSAPLSSTANKTTPLRGERDRSQPLVSRTSSLQSVEEAKGTRNAGFSAFASSQEGFPSTPPRFTFAALIEGLSRIVQEGCISEEVEKITLQYRFASLKGYRQSSQRIHLLEMMNDTQPPTLTKKYFAAVAMEAIIASVFSAFYSLVEASHPEISPQFVFRCFYDVGSTDTSSSATAPVSPSSPSLFHCFYPSTPATALPHAYLALPFTFIQSFTKDVLMEIWGPILSSISLFLSSNTLEDTLVVLLASHRILLFMGCLLRLDVIREACLQAVMRFALPVTVSAEVYQAALSPAVYPSPPTLPVTETPPRGGWALRTTGGGESSGGGGGEYSHPPLLLAKNKPVGGGGLASPLLPAAVSAAPPSLGYRRIAFRTLVCMKTLIGRMAGEFGGLFGIQGWLSVFRVYQELYALFTKQTQGFLGEALGGGNEPLGPPSSSTLPPTPPPGGAYVLTLVAPSNPVKAPPKKPPTLSAELVLLETLLEGSYAATRQYVNEGLFDFAQALQVHLQRLAQHNEEDLLQATREIIKDISISSTTEAAEEGIAPVPYLPSASELPSLKHEALFPIKVLRLLITSNLEKLPFLWPSACMLLLRSITCEYLSSATKFESIEAFIAIVTVALPYYKEDCAMKTALLAPFSDILALKVASLRLKALEGLLEIVKTAGEFFGNDIWSTVITLIGISAQGEFGKDFTQFVDAIGKLSAEQLSNTLSVVENPTIDEETQPQVFTDSVFEWIVQLTSPMTFSAMKEDAVMFDRQAYERLIVHVSTFSVSTPSKESAKCLETLFAIMELLMGDFAQYIFISDIWKIVLASISIFARCWNLGANVSLQAVGFLWTFADILGKECERNPLIVSEEDVSSEEDEDEEEMEGHETLSPPEEEEKETTGIVLSDSAAKLKRNTSFFCVLEDLMALQAKSPDEPIPFELRKKNLLVAGVVLTLTEKGAINVARTAYDFLWLHLFFHLRYLSLDIRPEVRNSALMTLTGSLITHGKNLGRPSWKNCVVDILMATLLDVHTDYRLAAQAAAKGLEGQFTLPAGNSMIVHHSRNSLAKQWDETLVIAMDGVYRVLSEYETALDISGLSPSVFALLQLIHSALTTAFSSVEVLVAAVRTLTEVMRLSQAHEEIAVCSLQRLTGEKEIQIVNQKVPSNKLVHKVSTWSACWSILWHLVLQLLKQFELTEHIIEVLSTRLMELYRTHGHLFSIPQLLIVLNICCALLTSPQFYLTTATPFPTPPSSYLQAVTVPALAESYVSREKTKQIYKEKTLWTGMTNMLHLFAIPTASLALPLVVPSAVETGGSERGTPLEYGPAKEGKRPVYGDNALPPPTPLYSEPLASPVASTFQTEFLAALHESDWPILTFLQSSTALLWNIRVRTDITVSSLPTVHSHPLSNTTFSLISSRLINGNGEPSLSAPPLPRQDESFPSLPGDTSIPSSTRSVISEETATFSRFPTPGLRQVSLAVTTALEMFFKTLPLPPCVQEERKPALWVGEAALASTKGVSDGGGGFFTKQFFRGMEDTAASPVDISFPMNFHCSMKLPLAQETLFQFLEALRPYQPLYFFPLFVQHMNQTFLDPLLLYNDTYRIALAVRTLNAYVQCVRNAVWDFTWFINKEEVSATVSSPTSSHTTSSPRQANELPTSLFVCPPLHPLSLFMETLPSIMHQLVILSRSRFDSSLRPLGVWKVAIESLYYILELSSVIFNYASFHSRVERKYWMASAVSLHAVTEADPFTQKATSSRAAAMGDTLEDISLSWEYLSSLIIPFVRRLIETTTHVYIFPLLSGVLEHFASYNYEFPCVIQKAFIHMVAICEKSNKINSLNTTEASLQSIILFPLLLHRCEKFLSDYLKSLKKKHRSSKQIKHITFILKHLSTLSVSPLLLKYSKDVVDEDASLTAAGSKFFLILLLPQLVSCIDVKDSAVRASVQFLFQQITSAFGTKEHLFQD